MRTSIIVLFGIVVGIGWISSTSPAMAQERPAPAPAASPELPAPKHAHRLLIGSSLGGASYGAGGTMLVALDVSYGYHLAVGRHIGVNATLGRESQFAGVFLDLLAIKVTNLVSAHLSVEGGVHRIHDRYESFGAGFLSESYRIVSAPDGVVLPYGGGKLAFERIDPSGLVWGVDVQLRYDLERERHTVSVTGPIWDWEEEETHDVGGRAITLGLHLGRVF